MLLYKTLNETKVKIKMNKKKFDTIPEQDIFNQTLSGDAYFASVHKPNTVAVKKWNGLPFFGVNLVLDEKSLARAEEIGLNIKDANDHVPGRHVLIKRDVKEGKTLEQVKPDVVDGLQNPIPEAVLIGNGSKVTCKFAVYWYEAHGGGVGSVLLKVQVNDLIPYAGRDAGDPSLEMSEDGFSISEYLANATPVADTPAEEAPFPISEDTVEKTEDGSSSKATNLFDD